jgi:hypothetical protein
MAIRGLKVSLAEDHPMVGDRKECSRMSRLAICRFAAAPWIFAFSVIENFTNFRVFPDTAFFSDEP